MGCEANAALATLDSPLGYSRVLQGHPMALYAILMCPGLLGGTGGSFGLAILSYSEDPRLL